MVMVVEYSLRRIGRVWPSIRYQVPARSNVAVAGGGVGAKAGGAAEADDVGRGSGSAEIVTDSLAGGLLIPVAVGDIAGRIADRTVTDETDNTPRNPTSGNRARRIDVVDGTAFDNESGEPAGAIVASGRGDVAQRIGVADHAAQLHDADKAPGEVVGLVRCSADGAHRATGIGAPDQPTRADPAGETADPVIKTVLARAALSYGACGVSVIDRGLGRETDKTAGEAARRLPLTDPVA